ncbi:zinc-binding dehydrogenase [Streptomyces sp. H27-C3]|uniref:zinc-binding dehydrogenase n=1 Tax=Streptomyces sp. H27-C3 TaxID=3046305 RepID=UPI0024B945FF|nr:zinc-binding dehydrogenase [Streptomyces sp. H27-C3]MDJ0466568.1 zinc-binding dehydrogenase [Streptomyces sp. H27-C3]
MPGSAMPTDEQIRTRNTATLTTYFRLLASLDIDAWIRLWSPDCEVVAPYTPGGIPAVINGREQLHSFYAAEAAKYTQLRYPDTEIWPLQDPRRAIARWFPDAELIQGGTYRNENVGFFEFNDDGLISRFVEYFNPLALQSDEAPRRTMRAVVASRYGGPEVLEIAEVPVPAVAADEVLVHVRASGTNPVDWECRAGHVAAWFDDGPYIWGWDISGIVETVGADVTRFSPGDEVYGMPRFPSLARGYAEYVSAPAQDLALKPRQVDHVSAAALPLCALTAWQVLEHAQVGKGQRVLVNGAAGGVGHIAVQLAKARGAYVVAVAREANHEFVRRLGADEAVDYTTTSVAENVSDIDVVVDTVGVDSLLQTVRRGGVIAPVSGAAQGANTLEAAAQLLGVQVLRHVVHPEGEMLDHIAKLVDHGLLAAEVTRRLPLEQADAAHRQLEGGHMRGKIVLTHRSEA